MAIDKNTLAITERLDKIIFWLRISSFSQAQSFFLDQLDTIEKRTAYQHSDGINNVREIAKLSESSPASISRWWSDWEKAGIVRESDAYQGRKQKLIELTEIGIKD